MKNVSILLPALAVFMIMSAYAQTIDYPKTEKVPVVDKYFDTLIADPYRWLENDTSVKTKEWVSVQNKVTGNYLSNIPVRENIRKYLTGAWNYARETPPVKVGDCYVFTKNNGLQNQNVWYVKKGFAGDNEELLDPNKLSSQGTAAVTMLTASKNKKYVAYAVAESGLDWNTIYIMDMSTRQPLKDVIKGIKFPRVGWAADGFYYARYAMAAGMPWCAVYYHKLGDDQQADKLVYEDKSNARLSFGVFVTEDERFLIITALPGSFLGFKLTTSTGNALLYRDLTVEGAVLQPLIKDYYNHHAVIDHIGNKLLLQTDYNAPNNRVVLVDPAHPEPQNWQTIIPEQKESLENTDTGGGYLWLSYLKDAHSLVRQYNYNGKKVRDVVLPALGTAANFYAAREDQELFYTFANFTTPATIYRYSISSGKSEVYSKPGIPVQTEGYETKQIFCASKDGTKIPVFIVHKKGVTLNGNNPAFMLGHGGFKRNMMPFFNLSILMFLENGGVYAQPALRGGNEYGEAWHRAGNREHKQNVFDDFISVAECLIKNGYTNPSRLAIAGQSTGGVLIGACINQRPDLMKVALPAVGMMDMLRYHLFTIGKTWAAEYGTSDVKEQFDYLIKYSPLHNIRAASHPATLITTADHDNTVVPAHSFKYAATLQQNQQGTNPVLIRIDTNTGHGPGKPVAKQIEEATDVWSFVFYNLGMSWKK
jgi:prolyl oligopeptidase